MSEKSDAWQLVVVGVSDQFVADERDLDQDDIEQDDLDRDDTEHDNSPNPCRDAKMLAKSAMLLGLCSEPVVFAKRSPMDEHDQLELQTALIEKLTKAAKKMKEKNINKMMVYYADHGRRTVSVDLDLLLEEAVVSAVEENELQYVCVIVLLDSCRNKAEDSPAYRTEAFPCKSNTYIYVYFSKLGHHLRDSSLVAAALMHMMQAQSDCTISHFLLRMSQLLRNITFGKINMEWVGLPQSADAALWPFFPAGRQSLPFGREDVNVMQREHYDALRGTFCVWGHLDCIIHDAVSLPEMLNDTEAMLKHKEKQLSASKPTLRRMISELRSIADIFFANRDLFLADWRQELQVAMCKSLEEVKETLEKVAQDTQRPGPETSSISSGLPHIPDLLRRCVLNARLKGYPQHHVEQALTTLASYFDKLELSATNSLAFQGRLKCEEGKERMCVLYTFVIDDVIASEIPGSQLSSLARIVGYVDGTEFVKHGSRIFLGSGSLWIILQSAKLDDGTVLSIHSHLEEWTHQLRQSRAAWHAARLQVVPRVAVPAGLLKLVHELGTSNLATGPVVVLSADNLRQLVAKRQGVNLSQLHVFQGPWGELSFSEAKDWKVLMQDNPSLSQSLQNLAKRTFGRQLWGDSPEFHGAAFLLHHQRAHLVSAAQVGVVSNAAAVAKSPAEFLKWVIEEFWEQLRKDELLRQEQLKEQSFDPADSEPMSNESDESDEWQLVVVGVSRKGEMYTNAPDDEDGANSCRDSQILAECAALMGICSEPVVFAKKLESEPEGDACLQMQMELREKLTAATTRMKQNNIKKMMVYYGGHGESIDEDRTVSCMLGLVLEDEVVRAVEMAMLEYVCAIVLLDSSRCLSLCHGYSSPPDRSPTNTYVFGYFCQFGDCMRESSLVPAALMHMMQAEKDDCEISFFLIRLKRLLLHITGGRTNMQLAGPLQRAAGQEFFPARCRKLKLPFERAKVKGLLDEEYEALRDTFAIYGHCDCIMDNVYETGVILQEMLEDTKQMVEQDGESHVPASKHTLRHLIPQLERIAKVFHKKKELFRSDWRREFEAVALQEVGRTSFDHVLQKLEELTEESEHLGSGSSWPRIPEDVRRCVVEARHRYYRKEGEQDLMSISHVSEVLTMLSKYFTPLPPLDSASCVLTDDLEEQVFIYKLTIHISAWCVDGFFLVNNNQQLAQLDHLHKHFTKNYTETNAYEIEICIDFG